MSDRTTGLRAEALRVVKDCFLEIVQSSGSDDLEAAISDDFVESLFEAAWKHQFDDDPSKFKREASRLVKDAAEAGDDS